MFPNAAILIYDVHITDSEYCRGENEFTMSFELSD